MRTLKKTLCLVLVLSMVLSFAAISAAAKFEDADEIEAKYTEAAEVLNAIGVLTGFEDGTFRPGETLTREQAAAIVARLLAFNGIGVASSFTDSHEWSDGYIAFCEQAGIVAGYGDGTFGPEDTLTGGQFMKMLLVALGYDPVREGMQDIGDAWIINVARLGKQVGLEAGIADFPYLDPITRDQAAQLALNALKSPLVQYDAAGNVGYITTTVAATQTISGTVLSNSNNFTIELGERYFGALPKLLRLTGTTDAFERTASKWSYNNQDIGTYSVAAKLSYTTQVTGATIFTDLGLSAPILARNVTVFVDGHDNTNANGNYLDDNENNSAQITDLSKSNINKFGGKGAVTDVYLTYNNLNQPQVKICVINTYVSKVTSVMAATSSRAASVTLDKDAFASSWTVKNGNNTYNSLPEMTALTYVTEAFAKDDVVAFTYSRKNIGTVATPKYQGIVSMKKAEEVAGNLDTATANTSITLDGTVYNAGRQVVDFNDSSKLIGKEVKVYLDDYGYVLYSTIGNIATTAAVLLGYQGTGSYNVGSDTIRLLFNTGSDATGALDATGAKPNGSTVTTNRTDSVINFYDITTYEGAGPYKLGKVVANAYPVTPVSGKNLITKAQANPNTTNYFTSYNTYAAGASAAIKFNGNTKFLVANALGDTVTPIAQGYAPTVAYTYSVYNGIANVPDMAFNTTGNANVYVAVYDAEPYDGFADTVFIMNGKDANGNAALSISSGSTDVVFVLGGSKNLTYVDGDSYYVYKAIVNGEVVDEFKTANTFAVDRETLYSGPKYNGKSQMNGYDCYANSADTKCSHATPDVGYRVGVYDVSADTVTFGSIAPNGGTFALKSDAKVFYITTTGEIISGGVEVLAYADRNDYAWYKLSSGVLTYMFIKENPAALP